MNRRDYTDGAMVGRRVEREKSVTYIRTRADYFEDLVPHSDIVRQCVNEMRAIADELERAQHYQARPSYQVPST